MFCCNLEFEMGNEKDFRFMLLLPPEAPPIVACTYVCKPGRGLNDGGGSAAGRIPFVLHTQQIAIHDFYTGSEKAFLLILLLPSRPPHRRL